jgi:hypothetical protein
MILLKEIQFIFYYYKMSHVHQSYKIYKNKVWNLSMGKHSEENVSNPYVQESVYIYTGYHAVSHVETE